MLGKKGKRKTGGLILALTIVAGVILLGQLGVFSLGTLVDGGGGDVDEDNGASGVTASTPLVNFNCVDLHNPQTSVSCNVSYITNGGGVNTDADGSGVEVSAGDNVEWYAAATSFYGGHGNFVMPEKNVHTVDVKLLNHDTSPSIKVYNEDDGRLNDATLTEALPANADDDLEFQVISSYKDGIMGATIVVDYVRTNIDQITSGLGASVTAPDSLTHNTTNSSGISTVTNESVTIASGTVNVAYDDIQTFTYFGNTSNSTDDSYTIDVQVNLSTAGVLTVDQSRISDGTFNVVYTYGSDSVSRDNFAAFLMGDLNVDTSKNKETKSFVIAIDVGSTTYGVDGMIVRIIDKDWFLDSNGGFSYGYEEPDENTDQGQAHNLFDAHLYTDST